MTAPAVVPEVDSLTAHEFRPQCGRGELFDRAFDSYPECPVEATHIVTFRCDQCRRVGSFPFCLPHVSAAFTQHYCNHDEAPVTVASVMPA